MTEPADSARYDLLRRKVIAVIVAVSVVPLLLINAILIYHYHVVYRDMVHDRLAAIAASRAKGVDGYLSDKIDMLGYLAASYPVADLARTEFLAQCLSRLRERFPGSFEDLGLVDPSGRQVAYAGPHGLAGAEYARAPWLVRALGAPESVSDVFAGLRDIPHFLVTVRIDTPDGPYVLRATADLAGFEAVLDRTGLGRTGAVFVVNAQGDVQAATPGMPEPFRPAVTEIMARQRDRSPDQAEALVREGPAGLERVYAATPLARAGWALILRQDADEAMAQLFNARTQSLIIFAAGLMGIALTAVLVSGRLVDRLAAAERERQRMRDQIVETGKLASIGELAAGVAHEINNPVAIMIEEAGWLGDLADDGAVVPGSLDEVRRSLGEIATQGRRCREITHKLLSFARHTEAAAEPTDLARVVVEIAALAQQKARLAGVGIEVAAEDGLPPVCLSASEMQQVLLNLINNAIDAVADVRRGDGLVRVQVAGQGGTVVVRVADNGPGVAPEAAERIFDPFFTTKPAGQGTGLGLSICHGLVAKMGGEIRLESEPGRGAAFVITLPARPSGECGPKPEEHP